MVYWFLLDSFDDILEYFYHNGISIFSNYKYYPNQVVYHKIYDAIEKQKRYFTAAELTEITDTD